MGIELIYNVVLVSGVQQSDSVIHIRTHVCVCMLSHSSHVQLFSTIWTIDHQAPLFMGFSMQEEWSGLPFPTSGDLPDPESESTSLESPALAGGLYH